MKREIDVFDYAKEITGAFHPGLLLTTRTDNELNTMTIGWGMLGVIWEKPVFIAYVREGRYTRELLDRSGEFTVNIPYGPCDKKILSYCGAHSGRNGNKINELGLTPVKPDLIQTPGLKELPLTLECKVLYRQPLVLANIPKEIQTACYPQDVDSDFPMANKDCHVAYYGEILKAYLIED